jgi:hypothetical protein
MSRSNAQVVNGSVHGQKGGFEDIDLVNFFVRDHGCGSIQCVLEDKFPQLHALRFFDLLGIVEQWMFEIVGQNSCSCHDRTCQTSASGFIATCYHRVFVFKQW